MRVSLFEAKMHQEGEAKIFSGFKDPRKTKRHRESYKR